MQNPVKTPKINISTNNAIKKEILKSKYTKITFGALGFIAALAALGSLFKILNYTVTNYKTLKTTLNK